MQFAQGIFHVTTFGQSFLSGASGTYVLPNFPGAGQTATVEWSQGAQNFIITGRGGTPPVTAAQVRYGNDLTCNGSIFTSTLSANGVSWLSPPGTFSPYQSVNRTSLGPFTETNNSLCPNELYLAAFSLTPGRRYALVQTLRAGARTLIQVDEGSALSAADLATQEVVATFGVAVAMDDIPGIQIDKAGELGTLAE